MSTVRIESSVPAPEPIDWSEDPDNGWAVVAHALAPMIGLLSGWLALTIAGRRSEFVRQHARQAVNFQINVMGLGLVLLGLEFGVYVKFGLLLLPILIAGFVWPLVAARRARRGFWMPYPQLIPFLRALPEPE